MTTKTSTKVEDLKGGRPYEGTTSDRGFAATVLVAQLTRAGFREVTDARLLPRGCRERVFELPVLVSEEKPEVGTFVRVFTSVVGGELRREGKDAIRVVGGDRFWSNRSGSWRLAFKATAKEKRVNRTGTVEGIANRTIQRCRDAYRSSRDARVAWEAASA